MITGFHHTSFTVTDVDQTERFFVDFLGMERVGGGRYDFGYIRKVVALPDAVLKIAVLAFPEKQGVRPPDRLELIEYARGAGSPCDTATNRPGNAHLCFVVDDIQVEHRRLTALGVKFKSLPQEMTFGVNRGGWTAYFNGPDGVALELVQPAKNDGSETTRPRPVLSVSPKEA